MAGYGGDAEYQAWKDANGFVSPPGSLSPAVARQRGSDYVDATYEPRLSCSSREAGFDQERAWPRIGHTVNGLPVPGIPRAWVNASYRAAWLEENTPGWASGSIDPNRRTKREKADVLEREFFEGGDASGAVGNADAVIQGMVTPFFCADETAGRGLGIWAIGR